MPYALWFSVFMIFAGLTLPRTSGMSRRMESLYWDPDNMHFIPDYSLFYYFLFWFVWVAVSLTFIIVHGIEYVNWPRLLPLSDIVFYDGPGFRSGNHGKGFGIPPLDPVRDEKAYAKRRRAGSRLGEVEMGEKRRVD